MSMIESIEFEPSSRIGHVGETFLVMVTIPILIPSISVPVRISVVRNNTYQLHPTFTNIVNTEVTYASNVPSVATVDSNGLIRGVRTGTTVIVITLVEDPSIFASTVVTVTA